MAGAHPQRSKRPRDKKGRSKSRQPAQPRPRSAGLGPAWLDSKVMPQYVLKHVPQQDNNFDCGCFAVHFIELFATAPPADFRTQAALDAALDRKWFKVADITRKRQTMFEKIQRLASQHALQAAQQQHHQAVATARQRSKGADAVAAGERA
mmetsp:Transcript_10854/g.32224  ORF Transcript_10854/g.32224 Transcript_10854/m.32224 type:complete len:151 (-) Transcript_10854:80-532(-)